MRLYLCDLACACVACVACAHGEPPAWDATPGSLSASPLPAPSLPAAPGRRSPTAPALSGDSPKPQAEPSTDASFAETGDAGAATLGQTRDKPVTTGSDFEARAQALWDGIVKDDPDLAMAFFFPLGAYQQVKDVGNPEADWRHRLVANYARDIHKLHQRLGSHDGDARLLDLDVPQERARWVEPGEEYNKLGYWRVYGAKLRYAVGDRPGAIDISSLISWRGQWFVVHLTGFK
jgi:hypothetical protein